MPLLLCVGRPLDAQVAYRIAPVSGQLDEPDGGFSVSLRFVGKTTVTFGNIGNLSSPYDPIDTTSEQLRLYDDGAVAPDARLSDDGLNLPDDGRTNSWAYGYGSQVTDDGTGIMFHRQSATSDGSTVGAESKPKPGVDIEYMLRLGGGGVLRPDGTRSITWGGMFGVGFNDINAKTRGLVSANLTTLTDTYSLDGAVAPPFPYTAPSSETLPGSDDTSVGSTVNTTVLLANRPYLRTETTDLGGAEVLGFWQVKGVSATARGGAWFRWRPASWWSLRASAGASFAYVGLEMRYDELINSDRVTNFVRDTQALETKTYNAFGYYAALDAEIWLTARTGFFGSVVVERATQDRRLTIGGRTADVQLSGGTGFRFGITTLF